MHEWVWFLVCHCSIQVLQCIAYNPIFHKQSASGKKTGHCKPGLWTGLQTELWTQLPCASWQQDIMVSVPAPPFDLCVAHVRNAACFGMPLGFLDYLRRNNLPTIISTFHVSELWLLTSFLQALLFHLMCCHCWTKFTKKILCLVFGLFLLGTVCTLVSCFTTTAPNLQSSSQQPSY